MNKLILIGILFLVGCAKLEKSGPYSGMPVQSTDLQGSSTTVYLDGVAYNADRVIVDADKLMHSFVKWEYDNRETVSTDATRLADYIRANRNTWINAALNARDNYVAIRNLSNQESLTKALADIQNIVARIGKVFENEN